ncbi:MAG: hypothetical protein ABIQ27_12920 [Flavobacterium sp.]|uniref:hypothetical protein n=1 Tax=Flavobacterium sp. TaxID=239 RepID=UPI003264972A
MFSKYESANAPDLSHIKQFPEELDPEFILYDSCNNDLSKMDYVIKNVSIFDYYKNLFHKKYMRYVEDEKDSENL